MEANLTMSIYMEAQGGRLTWSIFNVHKLSKYLSGVTVSNHTGMSCRARKASEIVVLVESGLPLGDMWMIQGQLARRICRRRRNAKAS